MNMQILISAKFKIKYNYFHTNMRILNYSSNQKIVTLINILLSLYIQLELIPLVKYQKLPCKYEGATFKEKQSLFK